MHLGNELRPTRFVEQQLGSRVETLMVAIEQDVADRLADTCATRLSQDPDRSPGHTHRTREQLELSRLAAPLATLEGDEDSGVLIRDAVRFRHSAGADRRDRDRTRR